MKYDPVKYKRYERAPIGCFNAEMTANGWANTKFDHDLQEHLLSDEAGEFVKLVHHFFKECPDWTKLKKFTAKYGTEIESGDYAYETVRAFNYDGIMLDYTFHIKNTQLTVFPYRKLH